MVAPSPASVASRGASLPASGSATRPRRRAVVGQAASGPDHRVHRVGRRGPVGSMTPSSLTTSDPLDRQHGAHRTPMPAVTAKVVVDDALVDAEAHGAPLRRYPRTTRSAHPAASWIAGSPAIRTSSSAVRCRGVSLRVLPAAFGARQPADGREADAESVHGSYSRWQGRGPIAAARPMPSSRCARNVWRRDVRRCWRMVVPADERQVPSVR